MEIFPGRKIFLKENAVTGVIHRHRLEGDRQGQRVDPQIEKEIIALLPRLRRFALALTRSGAAADDLAQAAVERAIANIDKWEPGSRLDSWIYRIAHNLFRNDRRNAAVRETKLDDVAYETEQTLDGERAAVARIEYNAVTAAIAALPGELREALLLVAVDGLSYREAAEVTGTTVAALTSRISRAREALREAVKRSE